MFVVVINRNNLLQDIVWAGPELDRAQTAFLDACSTAVSDWEMYTPDDKDVLLDEGYCEYNGNVQAVVLMDTSNCITDAELCLRIQW